MMNYNIMMELGMLMKVNGKVTDLRRFKRMINTTYLAHEHKLYAVGDINKCMLGNIYVQLCYFQLKKNYMTNIIRWY